MMLVRGKCGHWFAHDPAVVVPELCPDCQEENPAITEKKHCIERKKRVLSRVRRKP